MDEGCTEMKIIHLYSSQHCWNLIGSPLTAGGREGIKKTRFLFHCVTFFLRFNHGRVIISWSGSLRQSALILSGGESLQSQSQAEAGWGSVGGAFIALHTLHLVGQFIALRAAAASLYSIP